MFVIVVFLVRLLFGFVFAASFLEKVRNFQRFKGVVRAYRLVPNVAVGLFSLVITIGEGFLAVGFFAGYKLDFILVASGMLLILFSIAISINLLRGNTEIDCGCGGLMQAEKLSWKLFSRNMLLSLFLIVFDVAMYEQLSHYVLYPIPNAKTTIICIIFSIFVIFVTTAFKQIFAISRFIQKADEYFIGGK